MSDYAFVADRARKAFASLSKLESAVERNPEDVSLQINLSSMRRVAAQARAELERLSAINHIEICQYRIVPVDSASYHVGPVSRSLLTYQSLFSQIHDAIKNGKKSQAKIGKEALAESALDFAYSYSGSLGIVLLAKSDRSFFDGTLDKPVDALFQILDIDDVDRVKDIAHHLGNAVIKRVHDWTSANVEGGFATDVQWKMSDGRIKGQMVDRDRMVSITGFIDSTADEVTTSLPIRAVLVGGNVSSRTFHLTVPDGETYKGHIAPDAAISGEMTLRRIYEAELVITETYHYATDVTTKVTSLRKLVGPLDETGELLGENEG